MDLIASYFPVLADIPAAKLSEVRARLAQWYLSQGGQMDTRPGSVFGDQVLTEQAVLLAAAEIAASRFESDLTLANVADGIIFNCDVVEAFLQNFGKCAQDGQQARGIVRLIFTSGANLTIDRRLRFRIGGDPGNTFRAHLFGSGNLLLRSPGSAGNGNLNVFVFTQISRELFAVDIPVIGTMSKQVVEEDEALLDFLPPNLYQAKALVRFNDGAPAASLPELARKTCQTIYSASPMSRMGTQNYLLTEFPDIRAVSCLFPGDVELPRATLNPLGVWSNVSDVCITGRHVPFEETQEIDMIYFADQELLVAEWIFPSPPLFISSITCPTAEPDHRDYVADGTSAKILTASRTPEKYPGLSCSYSMEERLWLVVPMPYEGDVAQIPTTIVGTGEDARLVAKFRITYLSEPMVPVAERALKSSEVATPLVDVLVKSALPVLITDLTVVYSRRPGIAQNLDAATQEIIEVFHHAGHPTAPSPFAIADSMFYNGAREVRDVFIEGHVCFSIATHALSADHTNPTTDPEAAVGEAVSLEDIAKQPTSSVFSELSAPDIADPEIGTAEELFYRASDRNVRWLIPQDSIVFSENV